MNEHDQVIAIINGKNRVPVEMKRDRTALIVVDMQQVFTRPSSTFTQLFEMLSAGSSAGYHRRIETTVIPAIRNLLDCFRAIDAPVFFTATGTEAGDGRELAPWLRAFDELGTAMLGRSVWPRVGDPAWEIDERIAPRGGEPVLNKHSAGTFTTTDLDQHLRRRQVETVVVAGISTDVCVATTAREAADRGYRTVIVRDACTTLSEQMHQASLDTFNIALGWIRSADEVVAELAPTLASVGGE